MRLLSLVLAAMLVGSAGIASAQTPNNNQAPADGESDERLNPYGTGLGLNVFLSNHGFGFGGYYKHAIGQNTSLYSELGFTSGKDEQEQKFFSYWGGSFIPGKYNYFMMMPAHAGIERRLFSESILDNFRPFVQVTAGPTLGWTWPYFRDDNNNQQLDQNERVYDVVSSFHKGSPVLGAGGTIAFGAHFGSSKRSTQGIRLGYSFNYFFDDVQLMEPRVKGPQRFFGTPTISLVFGKLY